MWFAHGLAEALRAVHAAGVIHRDIKPSNVLLEGRAPVLIDFGHGHWPGRRTIITREPKDLTAKNAGYTCPEVFSSAPFGKPADLYRLGALLAHMLTGEPPKLATLAQRLPNAPPAVLALQAALTAHDPASRPAATQALVQEIAKLREACQQKP